MQKLIYIYIYSTVNKYGLLYAFLYKNNNYTQKEGEDRLWLLVKGDYIYFFCGEEIWLYSHLFPMVFWVRDSYAGTMTL
jgi:hypothetical protein